MATPGPKAKQSTKSGSHLNIYEENMRKRSGDYADMKLQRNVAFGLAAGGILCMVVSLCFNGYLLSRPAYIPMLLAVHDSGETQFVGMVRESSSQIPLTDTMVRWFIREFFINIFAIPTDQNILINNIHAKYKCMVAPANGVVDAFLTKTEVNSKIGNVRVEVEIITINNIKAKANVFQIDFAEHSYDMGGNPTQDDVYRATISLKTGIPTPDIINENPLGLFIDNIDIQTISSKKITKEEK